MEAGGEEPKRSTGPLEGIDGAPPLAHDVDQRGVERVGCAHPVPEHLPFLVGLLPFRGCLCVGPPHAGHHVGVGVRNFPRDGSLRRFRQETPLQDRKDLVARDRLAQLVHPRGDLVDLGQQPHVAQRLTRAPREGIDQRGVPAPGHLDGEVLEEVLGLALQGRIEDGDRRRPLHVLQHLIEQQEHRPSTGPLGEKLLNHVPAGRDAVPVVVRDDREGALGIDLPGDPAPHRLDGAWGGQLACRPAGSRSHGFAVPGVELLAVEDGHRHVPGTGKALRLGDAVECIAVARRVQQGSQCVRLAAAERGA